MAHPAPCFGTTPFHRVQPSAPAFPAFPPLHRLPDFGVAHLTERSPRTCSALRKPARILSLSKFGLLVSAAAGQEAATSTLVVQEVDFAWKGEGSEVLLTGDFLGWETKLALVKDSNGVFHAKQKLSPGNYRYKYIVDGSWVHSPDYPTVPDGRGGFNNEVIVTANLSGSKPSLEGTDSKDVKGLKPPETSGSIQVGLNDAVAAGSESRPKAEEKPSATPKVAPAVKSGAERPAKKVTDKPLPILMSEDVIPPLKAKLEKEKGVSNVDILFMENRLEGSFTKNGVIYSFWAYFPDGKL